MKKITLIFSLVLFTSISFSQNRKGQFQLEKENAPHQLYVAFNNNVHFQSNDYNEAILSLSPTLLDLKNEFGIVFSPGITINEEQFQSLSQSAKKVSGNDASIQKLKKIFQVSLDNPTNDRLFELAEKLEKLAVVDYCSLHSLSPIQPPTDIPPATPNWEANQDYIQSNPGINMQYAWDLGLNGANIKIRDVEYGFNKNHEELSEIETKLATGMTISSSASTEYTEHGTAVFGIMFGDKGNYGISGLSYGADEIVLFPEWQQTGYNRVNAVTQAIANSTVGDVIIYEMQTGGQGSQFVPAEFNNTVWDLTKAASDAGIIIVAAAGNGNQNLDASYYNSYSARGNSGAIICGAGKSNMGHNRISYSTFGSRVDLQAWGENVLSSGYGDAFQIGNDFNQYYTNFSGTSSATPLVAACVVVLQSYFHQLSGGYLTPQLMRTILKETGIPQGTSVTGNIGPIPNMEAAIQRVYDEYLLSTNAFEKEAFMVFPNPVENQFTIMTSSTLIQNASVEIINALGQVVYNSNLSNDKTIDTTLLAKGFYIVRITNSGKSFVKKIIKK